MFKMYIRTKDRKSIVSLKSETEGRMEGVELTRYRINKICNHLDEINLKSVAVDISAPPPIATPSRAATETKGNALRRLVVSCMCSLIRSASPLSRFGSELRFAPAQNTYRKIPE